MTAQWGSRMFQRSGISTAILLCAVLSGGLALGRPASAQMNTPNPGGEDLAALLHRMHSNVVANDKLANQYACNDQTHTVTLGKNGKKIRDFTAKFEFAVIDGLPYVHKVDENGVPLSAKRMETEQKHQDALSQIRRGMDFAFDLRDGNPRDSVYSALPICCLATLFENRVLRHEQINGRDNLVIESVPKAYANPSSPDDRTALDWKETTWIDMDDLVPTRYDVELLNDKRFLLKGSTERREFFRLEEAVDSAGHPARTVWLETYKEAHSILKFFWQLQSQTFEDTSYNYKKFSVDTRVLPNSVRGFSPESTSQGP
jgi:hypothetical protein